MVLVFFGFGFNKHADKNLHLIGKVKFYSHTCLSVGLFNGDSVRRGEEESTTIKHINKQNGDRKEEKYQTHKARFVIKALWPTCDINAG